jgi:hypothetical protein
MGSITSKPKTPAVAQQQPVVINYNYPAAATSASVMTTTPSSTTSSTTTPANDSTAPTSEEAKAEARNAGLLDRRRGILGTVLTGFRGILAQGAGAARKTLLGE